MKDEDQLIADTLRSVKTIAVVGASNKPHRASYGVMRFQQQTAPTRQFALFSYGFRPFFLLGAAYAGLKRPFWWSFVTLRQVNVSFAAELRNGALLSVRNRGS